MNYVDLRKLYYSDSENYENEYRRRVTSPCAVDLDFDIKGNPAFFLQMPELFGCALKILRADKEVQRLVHTLPKAAIEQFTNRSLVDEIVLTNRIEGVNSTRREIQSVINGIKDPGKRERVRKRFSGLVTMYARLRDEVPIRLETCQDIRALYDDIVLPEVVEEHPDWAPDGRIFRRDMASIDSAAGREIHHGAYPESAIISGVERALAFLRRDDIEILFRICVFHYMLEYIHPFYDGNGRLGRFIVSLLLSGSFEPLLAYRISYTVQEDLSGYYRAFKVCNDPKNRGDVTPFAAMMLGIIARSSRRLVTALTERSIVLNRYRLSLADLAEPHSRTGETCDYLLQASLFSERGISTAELMENLRISYVTLSKELKQIDSRGLLKKERFEKENFYSLDLERFDRMEGAGS